VLTSLPTCFRFEIFYRFRFDLFCFLTVVGFVTPHPQVFVKCMALHSGGFRFPLKRGFFLTDSRHYIVIWTSVSLISYMYLLV